MHWASSEIGLHFKVDSLPYLADCFRPLPEAYGLVGNWCSMLSYGTEVKRTVTAGGLEGYRRDHSRPEEVAYAVREGFVFIELLEYRSSI